MCCKKAIRSLTSSKFLCSCSPALLLVLVRRPTRPPSCQTPCATTGGAMLFYSCSFGASFSFRTVAVALTLLLPHTMARALITMPTISPCSLRLYSTNPASSSPRRISVVCRCNLRLLALAPQPPASVLVNPAGQSTHLSPLRQAHPQLSRGRLSNPR